MHDRDDPTAPHAVAQVAARLRRHRPAVLIAILWLSATGLIIAAFGCAGTRFERLPGDPGHCAPSTGNSLLIGARVTSCAALVVTVVVIVRTARANDRQPN